jgi:hypothetical protein
MRSFHSKKIRENTSNLSLPSALSKARAAERERFKLKFKTSVTLTGPLRHAIPVTLVALSFLDASTMPGPRNSKKKGKGGNKRSKPRLSIESTSSGSTDSQHLRTPSPILSLQTPKVADDSENAVFETGESYPNDSEGLLQKPFIHDPGNGHRVRDMRAFLSSFFAQPPALDDPLCAEFSQDEVLQMICTVLPEETALVRSSIFRFVFCF